MKKVLWLLFVVSLLATPSQADDRRVADTTLSQALPGTWNYVSDSTTRDGVFRPIEPTKIFWTLHPDGTGKYYRKINEFNAARVDDQLRWSVKGKTLTIDGDLHYTIIDWDESWMIWLNPSKKTFIRLEKQK